MDENQKRIHEEDTIQGREGRLTIEAHENEIEGNKQVGIHVGILFSANTIASPQIESQRVVDKIDSWMTEIKSHTLKWCKPTQTLGWIKCIYQSTRTMIGQKIIDLECKYEFKKDPVVWDILCNGKIRGFIKDLDVEDQEWLRHVEVYRHHFCISTKIIAQATRKENTRSSTIDISNT